MTNKLRKVFEDFVAEDDKKRNSVDYDVGKTIEKAERKIRNLKVKDIVK